MPARKRPRIMEGPEGFINPKPIGTSKVSNVHVPRFTPAFQGQEKVVHKPISTTSKHAFVMKVERVIARPLYNLPSTITEQPAQKIPRSGPLSVTKPASTPGSIYPSKVVPKSISLSKPVSKSNFKQLEFPIGMFVKPEKPSSDLRLLEPPISLVGSRGHFCTTSSLQRLPPPPPMRLPETPSKPNYTLKSLGLPPDPFKPSTTPAKSMRTVYTTHIALTNYLSTESGKPELASVFLHDQYPEQSDCTADGNWNLGISPHKMGTSSKGKDKEPKFVRYAITFSFERLQAHA